MGVRFRKSKKIAPGTRVNISRKSVGMSFGNKGGGISFNSRSGARVRASIPGTGISFSSKLGGKSRKSSGSGCLLTFLLLPFYALYFVCIWPFVMLYRLAKKTYQTAQAKPVERIRPIETQPISQFDPHIQVRTDTYTVYYAYGHVARVFPPVKGPIYENRDIINGADFIVSDGVPYDLTNIESIRSIAVPNYAIYGGSKVGDELGVTGYLEYILRMKAGQLWNNQEYKLSIAILEKATELMKYSTIGWARKDFYRIVNELNDLGCFKKAEEWESWIEENTKSDEEDAEGFFQDRLRSCKELNTDLVETTSTSACCEKCAMYRNRVFSLTGKDKRFPLFPEDFHTSCGLSVYPFVYGVMEPSFDCKDVIKYSNRPFVDDRTDAEKQNREEVLKKIEAIPPAKREPNLAKIIYLRLKQQFPDIAPKSFSGFQRMRNANSKNYQTLVEKATAAGFVFPESLEEVTPWEGIE